MADLPPLRTPAPPRDGKPAEPPFHFNIPIGALGSIMFLIVQLVGVVIWASNEHSQRVELQHQFDDFKVTMRERAKTIDAAVDRLDTVGSRRLALVEDRQTVNINRFNIMDERTLALQTRLNGLADLIIQTEKRVDELEKKPSPPP